MGDGRSARADRPDGARRARRSRLRGDRDRRAVDELLRPPRGSGTARRALQPHGDARRRPGAALDAPLLRQLQGPRCRSAALRTAFPAFLEAAVDEIHLEMASRELAEAEIVGTIAEVKDVAVGVIDVKSYYVETPEDVAARVRHFLRFAPPERLAFSTDCGLSQTARWAAKAKLTNLVEASRSSEGSSGCEGAPPRRRCVPRRRPVSARRARAAPLVARAERLPRAVRGPPPAGRPVPLRLAHSQVRGDGHAARPDHATRDRSRAALVRGRRPRHARARRPPRRGDAESDRRSGPLPLRDRRARPTSGAASSRSGSTRARRSGSRASGSKQFLRCTTASTASAT